MATRAIQDPLQILGFRDPTTDAVLAGGSVEFYAAGTLNAKSAWEDKDKVTAVTSVTLDSAGQAQLYFDGVYKFIVKNAAGTTKYTLDNLKYQARNTSTLTKTADYQCTSDDDYILVNTDGGAVTITLAAVAGVVAPITIKNIGSSSLDVTVDGSGAELIDGAATATLSDDGSQQYVTDGIQWYGAGIATGTTFTSTSLVFGTGIKESASSGVTTISTNAILGDSTDGRIIRIINLLIADGTNASTIKVTVSSSFNGDIIAETDNVAKGATTGDFTLNAGGTFLSFPVTGDFVTSVSSGYIYDSTTADLSGILITNDGAGNLRAQVYPGGSSNPSDLTAIIDTGTGFVNMSICYLTSS